jgi:hypothetical protein
MQCNRMTFSSLQGISFQLAIPVEMMTGKPVLRAASISSLSLISAEAILMAGEPKSFRNFTPSTLNAEEKIVMPTRAAKSNSSRCQARGVCATSYNSHKSGCSRVVSSSGR